MTSFSKTHLIQVFWALLVAFTAYSALKLIYFEWSLLQFPYQWAYRETAQLVNALELLAGRPIYEFRQSTPIIIEEYGPLNPWLFVPFVHLLGPELLGPRLVSLFFYLVQVGITLQVVYAITQKKRYVLFALGLIHVFVVNWGVFFFTSRPDSLGGAMLMLTLWLHWRYPYQKVAIFLSLLCGVFGFLAKIYFVCGFSGVVLSYWFVHKDRRMAMIYLVLGGTSLIGTHGVANLLTDGVFHKMTFETRDPWVSYNIPLMLRWNMALIPYLGFLAFLAWDVWKKQIVWQSYQVWLTHLFVCLPLFSALLINAGGGPFYLFTVIPAIIIVGMTYLHQNPHRMLPLLGLSVFLMLALEGRGVLQNKAMVIPNEHIHSQWKQLEDRILEATGPVRTGVAHSILGIRHGHEVFEGGLEFSMLTRHLTQKFGLSFEDPAERVRRQEYELIIGGSEADLAPYYRLEQTFELTEQFGRWNTKVKLFVRTQSNKP